MARFTDRGTGVPVVPGPDGAQAVGIAVVLGACDACGTRSAARAKVAVDMSVIVLCTDASACCDRYRGHVSPETYAAGLRGELLGVAP